MTIDPDELMGIGEIAELGRVTSACVSQWKRYADFPKPVAILKCGPIFLNSQVVEWMEENHK